MRAIYDTNHRSMIITRLFILLFILFFSPPGPNVYVDLRTDAFMRDARFNPTFALRHSFIHVTFALDKAVLHCPCRQPYA
jgi:hypothetical protein